MLMKGRCTMSFSPTRSKNTTESRCSTGTKSAKLMEQWYGECSEMLVFFSMEKEAGKRYRRWWQNTKVSSAVAFLVRKGPLGSIFFEVITILRVRLFYLFRL